MPPKSSSRGRPRRSTRASARRSPPQPPPALQSSPLDQSPPADEPSSPPSSTASAAAATPTVITASPLQSPSLKPTSPSVSGSVPSSGTPLTSETLPPKDADLDGAKVAVKPPRNDAVLDLGVSLNLRGVENRNPVSEEAAGSEGVEEAHGQEQEQDATAVEASGEDFANGGGGAGRKTKKTVRKTIKVVKKIVKKVPKRIVKGGPDSRVEELEMAGDNDDGVVVPSSNSLSNCLNSGVKQEEEVKPNMAVSSNIENTDPDVSLYMEVEQSQPKVDVSVSSNIENTDPDVSLSMEAEQSQQKLEICEQNVENEQTLEVQCQKGGASMEVDENLDGVVGGVNKEEEKDVPGEALNAAENGEKGTEEFDAKENPGEAVEAAADGDRNGEKRADEVEDGGSVVKPEDEMGESMCYSGEMEAMERRKRRKREIFVGGLDKDAKEEDIRKVFEEAGEVSEVRLVMNGDTGKNKGYAFLCYASAPDAKKALEKFSKVEICGKQCGAVPLEGNDTVYIGGIDRKWKDEDIAKLLQEIGIEGIDTVSVVKDPENKECNRGYAFVEFETNKDAQVALKKLHKSDVFGKNSKIKVAWAEQLNEPTETEMQKVKTVYAEYIPSTWDKEKVKENFEKFGEIQNLVLSRYLRNAKRKDYAFISYKTREAAITCIESFNRRVQNDEGTKVNVKVSLARPISRGRQAKQVSKHVKKEVPKERPKPSQGNVVMRQIDPKNKGGSTIHHYNIQRPDLHQNIVHREERSSTTSELVHLLREQAAWRPPHAGPLNVDYPTTFPGRKRPASTLDTDPMYSGMSGYPHYHLQTNLPSSSRYGAFPQGGTSASSAYYQGQAGYPSGLPYGVAQNYPGSEVRDRAHGNNSLYRRY